MRFYRISFFFAFFSRLFHCADTSKRLFVWADIPGVNKHTCNNMRQIHYTGNHRGNDSAVTHKKRGSYFHFTLSTTA